VADERDVTGIWYGSYAGLGQYNAFIAQLDERALGVTGTITERDEYRVSDLRRASVSGSRGGGTIAFVKQYDGAGIFAHAVDYTGQVNEEGTEITGHWSIEGRYRGTFVMRREKFAADELADEVVMETRK
tara:strand:- start:275 stop:664 length:390 start_codon:yes stop_codon:yes gene_type:complete